MAQSRFTSILNKARILQTIHASWSLQKFVQHLENKGVIILSEFEKGMFYTHDEETLIGFGKLFN
jgi:hypothetical protein